MTQLYRCDEMTQLYRCAVVFTLAGPCAFAAATAARANKVETIAGLVISLTLPFRLPSKPTVSSDVPAWSKPGKKSVMAAVASIKAVAARPLHLLSASAGKRYWHLLCEHPGAEVKNMIDGGMDLKNLIRTIPDYPKAGIMFRDITTLIGHAAGFREAIRRLASAFAGQKIDAVAGIEARGFILGGAVADHAGTGFVPIRKKGKLPWRAVGQDYQLEYGIDVIEMHEDAVKPGERILIVDDLIATGGTAEAAVKLIRRVGGEVMGAAFVIDLPELGGMARLGALGVKSHALVAFEGH